ncbi:MAG TPA: UbiD family decarboxylase [Trebonia sp.]|jgi:2,5-furandicarboxylate decarboxylase 1|nr:UbiD family decarboxylase [Trebonia sp.]
MSSTETGTHGVKDLRSYLAALLDWDSTQLVVVDKEVDPEFEVTAIVDRMRTDPGYGAYPAALFKNVRGAELPLLINLHGTYDRLARAIDATPQTMVDAFSERERTPVEPVTVDRDQAPVKAVVWTGGDARLSRLPILRHQELDAGKYITSAMTITRDPELNVQNGGIFRGQIFSDTEIGFQAGPHQNTALIYRKWQKRGEPMPAAMAIGHHPAMLLAGTTTPPGIGGELEVAGGLMGQPMRLVKAETSDLLVPADAEIVIEGFVDPGKDTFREEGPFGEYPRYYTGVGRQPVFRVTAITTRRSPVYVDVFNASPEHLALGGLARMGFLINRVRDVVPNVTALHLPVSGVARNHAYISIRKQADGEAHRVAFPVFAYSPATKHIFVVDDDIDVTNESEVLWALATRFQADKDLAVLNNSVGSRLNPPTYGYHRDEKGGMESKMIFDCTRPLGVDFPVATRVPLDVKERLDPAEYTRPVTADELSFLG